MITGVEIDFIVTDSIGALELYKSIFEVEVVDVTSLAKGQNEAVFTLYGTRFHMLDQNLELGMVAPKPDECNAVWFNVAVPDLHLVHASALAAGCTQIQAITQLPEFGAIHSMFLDAFGYVWMLHQAYRGALS